MSCVLSILSPSLEAIVPSNVLGKCVDGFVAPLTSLVHALFGYEHTLERWRFRHRECVCHSFVSALYVRAFA